MFIRTRRALPWILWSSLLLALALAGCASPRSGPDDCLAGLDGLPAPPVAGDPIAPTDYSDAGNWMVVTPRPTKPVDVFLLYPTAYIAQDQAPKLARIDDAGMRAGARDFLEESGSAIATAEVGNVFAPYYRQVDVIWSLNLPAACQSRYIGGAPKTDALAAFDYYYIRHYNQGRPFVLVGHSQGSAMTKLILFDYLSAHPDVYRRMVAAYPIGVSITQKELADHPHLRFAEGADDTGVVIAYNTEAPRIDGPNPVWQPGAIVINPITWTRGGELAPASANLGSHLKGASGGFERVPGVADARVDTERGVVVCSTADRAAYSLQGVWRKAFPLGVFHGNDLTFYYYNLRENAQRRIDGFLAANPRYKR